MILRHVELTGSKKAAEIIDSWDSMVALFWKVSPKKEVVKLEAAVGTPVAKAT
jgi:glutamate synthase domain-containing protein 3